MLRIPPQSLARRQFLGIPTLHETGVGPTGCPNKNFPAHLFNEVASLANANATRNKNAKARTHSQSFEKNKSALKCFGMRCALVSFGNRLLCYDL